MEEAVRECLLPAVTKWQIISDDERVMLSLPCREGGLGVINPVEEAQPANDTARACTKHLVEALKGREAWDAVAHRQLFGEGSSEGKTKRGEVHKAKVKQLTGEDSGLADKTKRAFPRASLNKTGNWLTIKPSEEFQTVLTSKEFEDGIAVRYAKDPLGYKQDVGVMADRRMTWTMR